MHGAPSRRGPKQLTDTEKIEVLCSLEYRPIIGEIIAASDGRTFDSGNFLQRILK